MTDVLGNENYDWEEFQRGAEYKNGYTENDETIRMFWEVFHELPEEEKRKFLLFLTGSVRIPVHGMKAIKVLPTPISVLWCNWNMNLGNVYYSIYKLTVGNNA